MKNFIILLLSFSLVSALFSAVEFIGINAEIIDHYVMLSWSTATETENAGFILERKLDSLAAWNPLVSYLNSDALLGRGTISSPTNYSFTDSSVVLNETYYYRISGVDVANNIGILDSLSITVAETEIKESIPDDFNLRAYPNPFNPRITISYQLTASSHVKMSIYNTRGLLVAQLRNGPVESGNYDLTWNTSNMPSGVYIIILQVGESMHLQKVVLIK